MKKYLVSFFILVSTTLFIKEAKCQWILIDSLAGFENIGNRSYTETGESFYCGLQNLTNDSIKNKFYLRADRADLIYFTQSNKQNILLLAGFYRLSYKIDKIDSLIWSQNIDTCWIKDLVWLYFNQKGELIKTEFYDDGKIIKTVELNK